MDTRHTPTVFRKINEQHSISKHPGGITCDASHVKITEKPKVFAPFSIPIVIVISLQFSI
jgi:hypothetical protein